MGGERSLAGWLFLASPIKQRASGLGATLLLRALTSSPASQPSWPWSQPAKESPDGAHVSSGVRAPEAGGPENELGAGTTLREAKGIVGALCKNRTPPNRRIFLSPRASPARGALSFCCGNIPGRETTRRFRAPAPSGV